MGSDACGSLATPAKRSFFDFEAAAAAAKRSSSLLSQSIRSSLRSVGSLPSLRSSLPLGTRPIGSATTLDELPEESRFQALRRRISEHTDSCLGHVGGAANRLCCGTEKARKP